MSKSARKRANKKAREAEAEEEPAPAPEPVPAAKPKATPKQAAAEPKAKAKAAAKAPAEPEAAAPKGKAKAKATAKAEPEPKAAAKAAEPKAEPAQAKPAAKKSAAKAGAKAAAAKAEPEPPKQDSLAQPIEIDDGTGGEWDVASGMSKKQQRAKEKKAEKQAQEEAIKAVQAKAAAAPGGKDHVPGMGAEPKAKAKGKAAAKADAKAAPAAAEPVKEAPAPAPTVADVSVLSAAVAAKAEEKKEEAPKENLATVSIKVPEGKVARIIGPKGSNINLIKEKTGIKTFEMNGEDCTLVGEPEAVERAEIAVREIIEKGYLSLAYENFGESKVDCPKIDISQIVGPGGDTIKKIKEECKVEIDIPKTDKDPKVNPTKKIKISIAGAAEGVEKAKEVINSLILYGHHELTHPGVDHKEMAVESWQYSFIIGKGGSEMRHIQNNFKVKVNIPREHSAIQNILIVGEPRDCERTVTYIEKLLEKANEPRAGGRDKEKAEDHWGDEGPMEDWMQSYMYKRK